MTTSTELLRLVKELDIPNFKGVFCKDELAGLIITSPECGVVNLNDTSFSREENMKTGHWAAWFVAGDPTNKYYFCSYGAPPPLVVVDYLKGSEASPNIHTFILTHDFQIQEFGTSVCGELACLWLRLMGKGVDYYDAVLAILKMVRG